MDAFSDPECEKIVVVKSVQSGGTEFMLNCIAWSIDQDPGDVLLVMPTEDEARDMLTERIKPMIEVSPRLARHRTGRPRDWGSRLLRLGAMRIYLGWSNSASSLATRPLPRVICDEVSKYKHWTGDEPDPVSLAEKRTTAQIHKKIVLGSTPTTTHDLLHREWKTTDQREYWVPCRACGRYQPLEFSEATVRWPKGERDPQRLKLVRPARYHCRHCDAAWDDQEKQAAVRRGVWCPGGCEVTPKGAIAGERPASLFRGYHWNALMSPFVSLSDVAAAFLASHRDVGRLMDFYNAYLGLPFEERVAVLKSDEIAALAGAYERGTVPTNVEVLTAGVDVKEGELHWVVRGWAAGLANYLIACGIITTWEQLTTVLTASWPRAGRAPLRVHLTAIDVGYRSDEVIAYCRRMRGLVEPVKGVEDIPGWTVKPTRPERSAHGGKTAAAGLVLNLVNTAYLKTQLARWISHPGEGVGRFWLHKNPPPEYCRQMASEHQVLERQRNGSVKAVWRRRPDGGPNHFFDCEVYALAAAERLQIPHALLPPYLPEAEAPVGSPDPERRSDPEEAPYWSHGGDYW